MTEVYFEDIHNQIINQISASNKSLKICVAWFTDVEIYQSIIQAQNRGVQVCPLGGMNSMPVLHGNDKQHF